MLSIENNIMFHRKNSEQNYFAIFYFSTMLIGYSPEVYVSFDNSKLPIKGHLTSISKAALINSEN